MPLRFRYSSMDSPGLRGTIEGGPVVPEGIPRPLMQRFGIDGTIRASLGLYSNETDIDVLADSLMKAREMLG